MTTDDEQARFPIGRFTRRDRYTSDQRQHAIDRLAALPARLRDALDGLDAESLDAPYRPGGWTVRQLVHHVADSHANFGIRLRLALTEDDPVIRPYDQDAWSRLADSRTLDVAPSLAIVDGVHARAVALLRTLAPSDFARPLRHPETGPMTIDQLVALYAWHGDHHVAHIERSRAR